MGWGTMKVFRGSRLKFIVYAVVGLVVLRLTGLYMYFCQENYFSELTYRSPQITDSIDQLLANREPQVTPTYTYDHGYRLLSLSRCSSNETRASRRVDVLFLVKSAVANYDNRMAIRRTWGLEKRFQSLGYVIQVVFLLALPADQQVYSQTEVEAEHRSFDDLVQGNFIDRYYNNTLKTVMGFGWAKDHCPQADFVMFVDDDFYVSTKNVLRLIAKPYDYPPEVDVVDRTAFNRLEPNRRDVTQMLGQHWYTGHLFFILPVRFYFHKFFVSLDEYPYNVFPPFINAGAYLVTRHTLLAFHYAAMYTQPIKLDDVYVGILARMTNVTATHNRYFFPYRVPSSRAFYRHLIATHGFRNSQDLMKVWNQQFEYGNA